MNLAIRGISGNLGSKAVSTFTEDLHKGEKFDFIMANPPFNQKAWRGEKELWDLLGNDDYKKELDRQFKKVRSNLKLQLSWICG